MLSAQNRHLFDEEYELFNNFSIRFRMSFHSEHFLATSYIFQDHVRLVMVST